MHHDARVAPPSGDQLAKELSQQSNSQPKGRSRAALAVALLAYALAATAGTAAAQAPDSRDFALSKTDLDLQARVNALDQRLSKGGVEQLLAEADRNAVHTGPCKAGAFDDIPAGSQWYCFQPDDAGEADSTVEWIPQGVTTVADAQEDGLWGSSEALLVSRSDAADEPKKGVRITFLDPSTDKYRHVLLAYPYINESGDPTYEIVGRPQGGIHGGGILWYGNFLYVVDTRRGIRVFDMRYIFDLAKSPAGDTTDREHIGLGDVSGRGAYRGFGYRYVMPQVGAWVNAAGPDNDDPDNTCSGTGAPTFSYISLDRSEVPDQLITGEYCASGDTGRVARWPLNGATGELLPDPADRRVLATDAYRLPADQIQGAVSWNDTWYANRSTGRDANGQWRPGQLIVARPDGGVLRASEARPAGRRGTGGPLLLAGPRRALDGDRARLAADAVRRSEMTIDTMTATSSVIETHAALDQRRGRRARRRAGGYDPGRASWSRVPVRAADRGGRPGRGVHAAGAGRV